MTKPGGQAIICEDIVTNHWKFRVTGPVLTLLTSVLFVGCLLVGPCTSEAQATPVPNPGLMAVQTPGLLQQQQIVPLLLTFDENGNAMIAVNGGQPTELVGTLMPDPADPNGMLGLTYLLPESVVTGDVKIFDPDGALSDALRFTDASGDIAGDNAGAGTRMIYYSDAVPDGGDLLQLADTGFPSNLGSENLIFGPTEIVGPGGSSFDYQPGGVAYPANNEYVGISDVAAVSEPSSCASLGGAIVLIGLISLLRRRAKGAARVLLCS